MLGKCAVRNSRTWTLVDCPSLSVASTSLAVDCALGQQARPDDHIGTRRDEDRRDVLAPAGQFALQLGAGHAGMAMSRIKHRVSLTHSDARNASADENAWAAKPTAIAGR